MLVSHDTMKVQRELCLTAGGQLLYLHKKGNVHKRLEQKWYAVHLGTESVLKGSAVSC